jgi:hypothetical protein
MYSTISGKYPIIYPPVPRDPATGKIAADFVQTNMAHFPDCAFVPWMLTDDPYFLEAEQAQATYASIENNGAQFNNKLPGMVYSFAPRNMAWGLNFVLRMGAFSPENPPSWLHPRAQFRKQAADQLKYIQTVPMASPIKAARIFHIVAANGTLSSWMTGYLLAPLGWARWSGFYAEWNDAIDWITVPLLRLSDDVALGGWDRRYPAPYSVETNRLRLLAVDKTVQPVHALWSPADPAIEDATPDSWGELWTLYHQYQALRGDPVPAVETDNKVHGAFHYCEIVRGALAAAALGGVPGAKERHDWLLPRLLSDVYGPNKGWKGSYRYNFAAPQ